MKSDISWRVRVPGGAPTSANLCPIHDQVGTRYSGAAEGMLRKGMRRSAPEIHRFRKVIMPWHFHTYAHGKCRECRYANAKVCLQLRPKSAEFWRKSLHLLSIPWAMLELLLCDASAIANKSHAWSRRCSSGTSSTVASTYPACITEGTAADPCRQAAWRPNAYGGPPVNKRKVANKLPPRGPRGPLILQRRGSWCASRTNFVVLKYCILVFRGFWRFLASGASKSGGEGPSGGGGY
jgi:hypothetical protein